MAKISPDVWKKKASWLANINARVIPSENLFHLNIKKNKFKILQVTDMHLHHVLPWSREKKDLDLVAEMVKKHDVDLVINTGDLFCYNAKFLVKRVIKKFDKVVGSLVPWAFAWGNHDNENFRPSNLDKLDEVDDFLESQPHSLYLANREFIKNFDNSPLEKGTREYLARIAPLKNEDGLSMGHYDGTLSGNHAIEIRATNHSTTTKKTTEKSTGQSGTSNSRVMAIIFILNSRRAYHVPENALKWMKKYISRFGKNPPPSFLFYHVPNVDYNEIWDRGDAIGIKLENVCHGKENGWFHEFLSKLPGVKACFVGHDHVNDYYGFKDGICYAYGRKTCQSGYGVDRTIEKESNPDKRKVMDGAKLIELDFSSRTWQFKSILWNGSETFQSGVNTL
ncbi:MAG: metallophosphoesterase [Promethearchaeota archaeon]